MFLAFVLIYSPVGKVTALSTVWHTLYLCYRTLFSTEGELIYFLAVGYSMPPSFISPCLSLFSSFGEVKKYSIWACTLYESDNQCFDVFLWGRKA